MDRRPTHTIIVPPKIRRHIAELERRLYGINETFSNVTKDLESAPPRDMQDSKGRYVCEFNKGGKQVGMIHIMLGYVIEDRGYVTVTAVFVPELKSFFEI